MAIHGRATIQVNGKRYNTAQGATLDPGGPAGSPVVGDGGFAGTQYENTASQIECTILARDDVSLEELRNIKNASVTFDSDNGRSYTITEADLGATPKLSRDGWAVTLHGQPAAEV